MKAPMRLVVLSLSIFALAACASMDEQQSAYVPAATPAPSLTDVDHSYMSQVERIARGRGIEVVWINPPTERSSEELLADNDN